MAEQLNELPWLFMLIWLPPSPIPRYSHIIINLALWASCAFLWSLSLWIPSLWLQVLHPPCWSESCFLPLFLPWAGGSPMSYPGLSSAQLLGGQYLLTRHRINGKNCLYKPETGINAVSRLKQGTRAGKSVWELQGKRYTVDKDIMPTGERTRRESKEEGNCVSQRWA